MMIQAGGCIRSGMQLPDPVAFTAGNFSVYWFGILFAVAIVAALLFTGLEARRKELPEDAWVDLALVLIPCGVVGARLIYVLTHLSAFRGSFGSIFRIWDGRLSVYGAVIFGLIGLFLYTRRKKLSLAKILDSLSPGLALALAIVAWGDFFEQQNYGELVENAALKWFPFAVLIEPSHTIHYAVFFYAFVACLLIFCLLWFFVRKRNTQDGTAFAWFATLYFGARFLLDLLLETKPPISAQIACLLLFLLGPVLFVLLKRRPLPNAEVQEESEAADALDGEAATMEVDIGAEDAPAPEAAAESAEETPENEPEPLHTNDE